MRMAFAISVTSSEPPMYSRPVAFLCIGEASLFQDEKSTHGLFQRMLPFLRPRRRRLLSKQKIERTLFESQRQLDVLLQRNSMRMSKVLSATDVSSKNATIFSHVFSFVNSSTGTCIWFGPAGTTHFSGNPHSTVACSWQTLRCHELLRRTSALFGALT